MQRSSPYYPLAFRVDCQVDSRVCASWETIAAFNVDVVAQRYADECKKTNPYNLYRVMERKGRVWVRSGPQR